MNTKRHLAIWRWVLPLLLVSVLVAAYFAYPWLRTRFGKIGRLREWLQNPSAHAEWAIKAGQRCGDARFILPTDGFVGFSWRDSFRPAHQHQGIDIFGGEAAGKTPVVSVYPGYLTRLSDWKSTVIVRIPADPLDQKRQIWTYYTHMADKTGSSYISPDYPPGTSEKFVEAGTFLGYQGDFSGTPGNPVGVHLHFSIVMDDGQGSFRNELEIANTLDPSLYLGLPLDASQSTGGIVICETQVDN